MSLGWSSVPSSGRLLLRSLRDWWVWLVLPPAPASGISTDNLDVGLFGEYMNINPSWEDMVVNKIKNMLVTEQGLVLDTICHFLEKESQVSSESLILLTGWEIHGAWEKVKELCGTCPKPPC